MMHKNLSFEKSNIEKVYEFPDKNKKNCLKLVAFKKEGYVLISNIKNVENPPVLFYSKGKYDPKNPNPGLVIYMEDFNKHAARDTINAFLPGQKKNKKKSDISKKNLTRSYGYRSPDEYCYDRYGQRRKCARDCLWNRNANCRYRYYWSYPKQCGAGFCYDNFGQLHTTGRYRKETIVKWIYNKSEKGPLLKTRWYQGDPYNNTLKKHEGDKPLGCVAVAVGQIIAYYRKDKHYPDDYDWSEIHQEDLEYHESKETDISKFLWDIAEGVNTDYNHPEGSGAYDSNARDYFKRAGYRNSNLKRLNGDYTPIFNELYNDRPVYLAGDAIKIYNGFWEDFFRGNPYRYGGRHAWVADGYKNVSIYRKIKRVVGDYGYYRGRSEQVSYYTEFYCSSSYIHMNWGKGSGGWRTYDYWRAGIFSDQNYQYNKKIIIVKP